MKIFSHIAICAALPVSAFAQAKPSAAIPATPPTAVTTQPAAHTESSIPTHAPVVTWEAGQLKIVAQNSSLNSILRSVALKTGMKIEGGVQDERVFGTYGPDLAATVLAQLMDGTKCNMMLQSDAANLPIQLTLTPVTGGVTPPNPMQAREEEREEEEARRSAEPPPAPPSPPATTAQPGALLPNSNTNNGNANTGSGDQTTQPQAPGGALTPQQVFEQLKLRQQRDLRQQQTPTQ